MKRMIVHIVLEKGTFSYYLAVLKHVRAALVQVRKLTTNSDNPVNDPLAC
jgi:hypothetical protein